MKAVNQSIGRVIRHVKDYGAVVLLDERYAKSRIYSAVSSWLKQSKNNCHSVEECTEQLGVFFKKMQS